MQSISAHMLNKLSFEERSDQEGAENGLRTTARLPMRRSAMLRNAKDYEGC